MIRFSVNFHFLVQVPTLTKRKNLKQFLTGWAQKEGRRIDRLDYIFCDDRYLLAINQEYLNHDDYTDIITFDLSEGKGIVGEIYISAERVRENSITFGTGFKQELHRVIFHGLLHLLGYKDKTKADREKMRQKEEELIKAYSE